jgi:hypothetical protein
MQDAPVVNDEDVALVPMMLVRGSADYPVFDKA